MVTDSPLLSLKARPASNSFNLQAIPTPDAALPNATRFPAPAITRLKTPTSVSAHALREMALLPIPRSTPIASKLASAPTSSPLMDLLPLVPPALVLLHQAVKLLRLVPSLAPRLVVCAAHYHIDEIPLANIFQPPMPLALSPAPALVLQRPALPRPATPPTPTSSLVPPAPASSAWFSLPSLSKRVQMGLGSTFCLISRRAKHGITHLARTF